MGTRERVSPDSSPRTVRTGRASVCIDIPECKYSELVRGPAFLGGSDTKDNQLSMGNEESYCAPTREDGDGQLDCCECHRIHRDAFYASEEFLVSQCILRMLSVRILRIRVRV
jgi:hypothetical protein